jgi:hypothetical protein
MTLTKMPHTIRSSLSAAPPAVDKVAALWNTPTIKGSGTHD